MGSKPDSTATLNGNGQWTSRAVRARFSTRQKRTRTQQQGFFGSGTMGSRSNGAVILVSSLSSIEHMAAVPHGTQAWTERQWPVRLVSSLSSLGPIACVPHGTRAWTASRHNSTSLTSTKHLAKKKEARAFKRPWHCSKEFQGSASCRDPGMDSVKTQLHVPLQDQTPELSPGRMDSGDPPPIAGVRDSLGTKATEFLTELTAKCLAEADELCYVLAAALRANHANQTSMPERLPAWPSSLPSCLPVSGGPWRVAQELIHLIIQQSAATGVLLNLPAPNSVHCSPLLLCMTKTVFLYGSRVVQQSLLIATAPATACAAAVSGAVMLPIMMLPVVWLQQSWLTLAIMAAVEVADTGNHVSAAAAAATSTYAAAACTAAPRSGAPLC